MPLLRSLFITLLLVALAVPPANAAKPSRRTNLPNLILIVADDLGYGDLGCYGQEKIKTPNLDRLAADGMKFTQAYAGNTVCAPSRSALMTGKHSGHGRVRSNAQVPLEPNDVTIAEVLRPLGYRTGAVGKWALGWEGTTGHPNQQGFEQYLGWLDQSHAHDYYPTFLWRNTQRFAVPGNQNGQRTDYAPAWLNKFATNFVRIYEDQPFFLYYAPTFPHANNERGTNGMEVPSFGDYAKQPWPAPEKGKAAMITYLDTMVGTLLDDLKRRQLDEETLILFTSDNGPHKESGVNPDFFRSSGPLRGLKRDLYEGGIRVPLIARWPGQIKAGTTNTLPVANWDFLATLAEVAGTKAPKGLDGISFAPSLFGRKQTNVHEAFYWEFHERGYQQAVRMGDWKAVKLASDKPLELYNLATDLGETNNVAATQADVIAKIEAYLATAADKFVSPTNTGGGKF
jgi:arylsulfatase A-like enzyme